LRMRILRERRHGRRRGATGFEEFLSILPASPVHFCDAMVSSIASDRRNPGVMAIAATRWAELVPW
jgi:hypothetical protein